MDDIWSFGDAQISSVIPGLFRSLSLVLVPLHHERVTSSKKAVHTFMATSPPPLTGLRVIELAGLAPGTYQPSSIITNRLSNSAPRPICLPSPRRLWRIRSPH